LTTKKPVVFDDTFAAASEQAECGKATGDNKGVDVFEKSPELYKITDK